MNETLSLRAICTRAAGERRALDVIASTDAVDSYGEIVAQQWQLERYAANPVVLYSHESHELPIGRAENVRVEDGKLLATLVLATGTERAEEVWSLVQQGMLRGVSVGFRPHTTRWEKRDGREVLVLDDNELLEISITPIPANPEALAQLRARALGGRPAPTEKRMKNVLLALGLGAEAEEATAVQVATQLRSLVGATGKSTASEALGVIEGLKAKATRVDELEAEITTRKSADEKRDREALLAEAKDLVAPGSESTWATLRTAPLADARKCLDAVKETLAATGGVKRSAVTAGATLAAASPLTELEAAICHQLGINPDDYKAEKARRAALTTAEEN